MQVSKDHASRNSEQDFGKQLLRLVDSGAGVIHVRASEVMRAILCIRRTALLDQGQYHEWDIVNGLRGFTLEDFTNDSKPGDGNVDLATVFSTPLAVLREQREAPQYTIYYVYVNPHPFMENNPHMHQLLLMYNEFLPSCKLCVLLVTPDIPLPDSAANSSILSLTFQTPGLSELRQSLSALVKGAEEDFPSKSAIDKSGADRICFAGAGMSALQFETYVSLGITGALAERQDQLQVDDVISAVQVGKTDIVNQSDILELYPSSDIDDVGGMDNLKDWVRKRANCYSDEAVEFGIEAPKGMVLVGPPGTGKSLVAKATSSVLGVPLVRMDFGKVFSSLVGSSEERIRRALRNVEAMSPCVLFCDEIDKGLGGIAGGSGGDSGVSMRVLGSFLTWLQDCTFPVFTLVTANNIDQLPPELLRRGRFDAIFSTSLPNPTERKDVLAIHLRKRGRDIEEFSEDELRDIITACDRYVPSEIESAVKDGLIDAFSEGEDFAAKHVLKALRSMVPLSKAFATQIEKMNEWAKANATPVALSEENVAALRNRSRVSPRRRINKSA